MTEKRWPVDDRVYNAHQKEDTFDQFETMDAIVGEAIEAIKKAQHHLVDGQLSHSPNFPSPCGEGLKVLTAFLEQRLEHYDEG
jgi:hypothetical protein